MENSFQKISEIKDNEIPFDFSKKVIFRIKLMKLEWPLILAGLLFANLAYLSVNIYNFLIDTDSLSVLSVIYNGFDLSWDYIADSWNGILEIMPMNEIYLLLINIAALCFLGYFVFRFFKLQSKKTVSA